MESIMDNVVEFPTPRERAGVSMLEDMDMLLDALVGAALALQHSENVGEDDREGDVAVMTELLVKYFNVRGERYPSEGEEEE
jgi:hypothetical protein